MNLSKKELIYAGVGLLVFLVIYASTRKVDLVEVSESEINKKSFDNSRLPTSLKPPVKLMEGESIPQGAKRKFNGSLKPRFDV